MKTKKLWSIVMMLAIVLSVLFISSCSDDESNVSKKTKLLAKQWQIVDSNIGMSIWDSMNGVSNQSIQFFILDPTSQYGIAVGDPLNWSLENNTLKVWSSQGTLDWYTVSVSNDALCLDCDGDINNFIASPGQSFTVSTNAAWIYGRWINVENGDIYELNSSRSGRLLDKYMKFKRLIYWGADSDRFAILYRGTGHCLDNPDSDLFKIISSNSNTIEMINSKTSESITLARY